LGKTYWMLVTTQENLDITRARGFSMQGVDTKNRRKAIRMGPEDRVLYYVSDKKGFAATATVTSDSFEDHEPIWKHHREQETFPHRVEIEADVVVEQIDYIDGYQVGPTLEYVKKWSPDRWPQAFFGMLHIIPQRDFNFVEAELRRITGELPALEPSESDPVEISTTTAVVSHVTTPTVTAGSSTYAEQRGSKKLFDRPRKGRAKVKRQRRSRRLAISHKPRLF
jgi:predicted RNA-binding protein